MNNMLLIISVASGGALGALLRFGITKLSYTHFVSTFPYATLGVNLVGSLLMGMLVAYFEHHPTLPPHYKYFLLSGLLGALTTYSTFAMESVLLLQNGEFIKALSSIVLNVLGTILLAALGYLWIGGKYAN